MYILVVYEIYNSITFVELLLKLPLQINCNKIIESSTGNHYKYARKPFSGRF